MLLNHEDAIQLLCETQRTLRQEIDMLTTALIAHGKGKHHIVEDHVDRSLCNLAKLHDKLKES